jgi:TPR repeat protein
MLFVGRGISADRAEGYKWIALAAQQGHEKAKEVLQTATQRMLPEEILEGQRKASAFVPKPTNLTAA